MKRILLPTFFMLLQTLTAQYGDYSIKQIVNGTDPGVGYYLATDGDDLLVSNYSQDKVFAYHLKPDSTWEYIQTLSPSDKKPSITKRWSYGSDLAISGDNAVIGASDKGTINEDGAVYFYHKGSDGLWHEEDIKNVPFDTIPNIDYYYGGQNLQIHGSKATVSQNNGAPNYVHIYERSANGKWSLSDTIRDNRANISNDKAHFAGDVYISGIYKYPQHLVKEYRLQPNGSWLRTDSIDLGNKGYDDYFGDDLAVEGNTMVLGAYYTSQKTATDSLIQAGTAYIYERVGGKWQLAQTLKEDTVGAYNYFGASVAIQNGLIVISAYGSKDRKGVRTGAVYLYRKTNGVWTKIQTVTPDAGDFFAFGSEVFINKSQILVGSTKGVYVLQGLLDCNYDKHGTAVLNSCGICVEGNTGIDSLASEQQCITRLYETSEEVVSAALPNPFQETLTLNLPLAASATLIDVQGKAILSNLSSGIIPTADLPKGFYFLKIATTDAVKIQRLVK